MAGEASMLKFLKPKSRLQPVDVQAAAFWGVAAVSGALYLIQVFSFSFVHFVLPLNLDLLYLCSSFFPLFLTILEKLLIKNPNFMSLILSSAAFTTQKELVFSTLIRILFGIYILFFWKLLVICSGFLYMLMNDGIHVSPFSSSFFFFFGY